MQYASSESHDHPVHLIRVLVAHLQKHWIPRNTLQPLYNTVRYNTILDITRFKDGSQKCIDYIEK